MESWFTIIMLFVVFAQTIWLLLKYPTKDTPPLVYAQVFLSYFITFAILILLPYDVYLALGGDGSKTFLFASWKILYWTVFALCWFILPISKGYFMAGQFTFFTKLRQGIYLHLRSTLVFSALGVAFIVYLFIAGKLQAQAISRNNVPAFLVALGNVWGLFLIIVLLGYGLVIIPRTFWNKGNFQWLLDHQYFKALMLDQEITDLQYNVNDLVRMVKTYDTKISPGLPFRQYVDKMLQICPQQTLRFVNNTGWNVRNQKFRKDEIEMELISMKKLVELNKDLKNNVFDLKRAVRQFLSSRWDQLRENTLKLEDIINNKHNPQKVIVSQFRPRKTGRMKRCRQITEWAYLTRIRPILMRVLGIFFALCSILVVLGEITLFISAPVGVIPIFFQENQGLFLTQSLCLLCLSYLIYCTFVALFRLKLKGRYGLYKNNHTDPPNLLWAAFIMARMTPPLCYNFLLFIKVNGTQFDKVLGILNLVPILGEQFTVFFPMLLLIFVILNLFQVYSRLMAKIGIPQFGFSDFYDEDKVFEGKRLIQKYRTVKERTWEPPRDERTVSMQNSSNVWSSQAQSKTSLYQKFRETLNEPLNR